MPSFNPEEVSEEKVQHEIEQMHAEAMRRLRASEDFVLFSFDKEERLWRTAAAVGKFQDINSIQGLFQCIHKLHEQIESTHMAVMEQAIHEHNVADWKGMDEQDRNTLRAMLVLFLGEEAAAAMIEELENAEDDDA